MEEKDEIVPEPNDRGLLDLSNRGWVNLDPIIFTMSLKLVRLDISYNNITEIPSQIGGLSMLRELTAAFNKIGSLPPEIGKCKRLRRISLQNNRIRQLPEEIGHLEMLEELIVSENQLEVLPTSLSSMHTLRVLKLQSNNLTSLPCELADVLTLEVVDCSNNPRLSMVPPTWRGDTATILFICRVHRDYQIQLQEITLANSDLAKHSQFLEQEQLTLKGRLTDLKFQLQEATSKLSKRQRAALKLALEGGEEGGEEGGKEGEGGMMDRCSVS